MAIGETQARVQALSSAAANPDDKTVAFIQALADDAVKVSGQQVLVVRNDKASDPVTGVALPLPADADRCVHADEFAGGGLGSIRSARLRCDSRGRRLLVNL